MNQVLFSFIKQAIFIQKTFSIPFQQRPMPNSIIDDLKIVTSTDFRKQTVESRIAWLRYGHFRSDKLYRNIGHNPRSAT